MPASLSEEVVQRCAARLCAERLAVLAVLKDVVVTVQAGAAAGDDRAPPPYAAAAGEALTQLMDRVRHACRAPACALELCAGAVRGGGGRALETLAPFSLKRPPRVCPLRPRLAPHAPPRRRG
jgi:hypothetical protein